uniref:cell surface glycoprotein 1-like n=1 Tax=Scatophagus argus TaxID=75038 RepID=UPI001ED82636|nr:cell surface glycoprotein 1-like [Scatophagus argus]XP_046250788.1 cell surface glycoprotein 1-like [Scatophagus argus]
MGNKFSRRRDAPANSAENAAGTEEKTAEEPAEDPGTTQTQEAIETEDLSVTAGEPVTLEESSPPEERASEFKDVNDVEPEPLADETSAQPVDSVTEAAPAAEPAPEPVPEPDPSSKQEAVVEAAPEPISESVPAPTEALEEQTDMLTQESLPEPVISSSALIDLGVPDATPQPDTPPSPAPILTSVNTDEPSDIPVTEECQDNAEVSVISAPEPENSEERSESLEKLAEVEAAGNLEQLVSDVSEESVSGLLQNLELKGNDLVADLIPTDVKIPDDTPITDMSASTELM